LIHCKSRLIIELVAPPYITYSLHKSTNPTILFGKYILNVTLFFISNYIGMPLEIKFK